MGKQNKIRQGKDPYIKAEQSKPKGGKRVPRADLLYFKLMCCQCQLIPV